MFDSFRKSLNQQNPKCTRLFEQKLSNVCHVLSPYQEEAAQIVSLFILLFKLIIFLINILEFSHQFPDDFFFGLVFKLEKFMILFLALIFPWHVNAKICNLFLVDNSTPLSPYLYRLDFVYQNHKSIRLEVEKYYFTKCPSLFVLVFL